MKVIGKDRTSCDVCNPIDEILARLDALERRASAIVAKVQGLAPDGEGNVTLPTSSSDTDPLHGRVDTFAMSSEVKEAADDAHAYAASIADDVLVINSEIDALNQAVEVLQPAEIEALKSAVQTLQTTVATLESTVGTLNSSVAGKVSKSGDTMTGILSITSTSGTPRMCIKHPSLDITTTPLTNCFIHQEYLDKNGKRFALIEGLAAGNSSTRQIGLMINSSTVSGNDSWSRLQLIHNGSTAYATAPSWSVGTNDNSDKILTIKMVNSLPSLVHSTGNETKTGTLTLTSKLYANGDVDMWSPLVLGTAPSSTLKKTIAIKDSAGAWYGEISSAVQSNKTTSLFLRTRLWDSSVNAFADLGINILADGTAYASAPTPSSASDNSTKIATTAWVNTTSLVVHTSGDETIEGVKTFSSTPIINNGTPSDATGTEIATANWVIAKINELATKNKLTGL